MNNPLTALASLLRPRRTSKVYPEDFGSNEEQASKKQEIPSVIHTPPATFEQFKGNQRQSSQDPNRFNIHNVSLKSLNSESSEDSSAMIAPQEQLLDLTRNHTLSFRNKKPGSPEIYLDIRANSDVTQEGSVRKLRSALYNDIASFFSSKGKPLYGIGKSTDSITFPNIEMLNEWNKEAGLAISDSKVKTKKIVVIGLGDVGEAVVKKLANDHERDNLPCEIVVLNRNTEHTKTRFKDITKSSRSCVSYVVAQQDKEIADADMIILTAGVRASRIDASSRKDALKYNVGFVRDFAKLIGGHIKQDTKVIVVTNPIENITQMVQEISGIDPKNIIGSGTGLDSIRYTNALEREFGKHQIIHPIQASVVGPHGEKMIFASKEITMNGKTLYKTLAGKMDKERIDEIVSSVEGEVITAGYPNKGGKPFRKGTCDRPAEAVCELAHKWLYGDKSAQTEKKILSTAVYVKEGTDNPYGVQGPCFIGLPVTFEENGELKVKSDYLADEKEIARLREISTELVKGRVEVTSELLATSILLNAVLERNEANSDVMKHITTIMTSKDGNLASCSENLRELYSILIEGDELKIGVRAPYAEYEEYLLKLLNVALRDSGLIDKESDTSQCSIVTHGGKKILTILTDHSTQSSQEETLDQKLLKLIGSQNQSPHIPSSVLHTQNAATARTLKGEVEMLKKDGDTMVQKVTSRNLSERYVGSQERNSNNHSFK